MRSSTIRSGQGAPWTASKVSLRFTTGRNEPKRLSGSTIRSTLRAAAVRHICSGAWPASVDKPTSKPRCRTSHIRQSSASLAGSESGEVGRSSLPKVEPDCRGSPCINVSRAVKSLVSSIANSTAGLDSARRSVRRSSCVSLEGIPEITCCPGVTRSTGALGRAGETCCTKNGPSECRGEGNWSRERISEGSRGSLWHYSTQIVL